MRWLTRRLTVLGLSLLLPAAMARAESVFETLYPQVGGTVMLPFPLGRLLDDIRSRSQGATITVAFVPLGRSLQRLAAAPDFFKSPRIIAAVTGDGTQGPLLRDRLFIGYQPAVGAVEVIAFDAAQGRFVFQEYLNYGSQGGSSLIGHEDGTCSSCHQAQGPIFPAAPWQETNANPAVVRLLEPAYEGLEVKVDFDGLDSFDRSVRQAARLQAAARLWREGCGTRDCRAALVAAALTLSHPAGGDSSTHLAAYLKEISAVWPQGLTQAASKIPDYDAVRLVEQGVDASTVVETTGPLNPETPRAAETFWSSGPLGAVAAARLTSELFGVESVAAASAELNARQLAAVTEALIRFAASDADVPELDGKMPDRSSLGSLLKQAMPVGGLP